MATRFPKIERYFCAAFQGNLTLLKQLAKELDNGEGLKRTYETLKDDEGKTALHFAAAGGQPAVCDYLVNEMKLDLHSKDEIDGCTALHHAVRAGSISTARYLIQIGANVSLRGLRGWAPLHEATGKGNVEMMELLVSSGADIEPISECDTPLHLAAVCGRADLVEFLLNHKANPNSTGTNGTTPLLFSISAKSLECVKLLLKAGADPNLVANGVMPLIQATNLGQSDMVQYMQEHGAVLDLCGYILYLKFWQCTRLGWRWTEHEKMRKLESGLAANLGVGCECCGTSAQYKEKGKVAFKEREYHQAAAWFTKAINLDPTDEMLFSNRSICWLRLSKGDKALDDALACVELKPNWSKAHYREGAAYKFLKNYEKAAKAFGKALQLDPDNKEILKELQ